MIEQIKKIVQENTNNEEILYINCFDIDKDDKFTDGYIVITTKKILIIQEQKLINIFNIKHFKNYKAISYISSGLLEAKDNDDYKILVRYSMKHCSNYKVISKILNNIINDKPIHIKIKKEEEICPKCGNVIRTKNKQCLCSVSNTKILKKLWNIASNYRKLFIIVIILYWVGSFISVTIPYMYKLLIDKYILKAQYNFHPILICIGMIALLEFLSMILNMVRQRIRGKFSINLSQDLRKIVYNKIQMMSLQYITHKKTGLLMNRVTQDTNNIQSFIESAGSNGVDLTITFISIFILLCYMNIKLALLIFIPLPIVMFISYKSLKKIWNGYKKQWNIWEKINNSLQDVFSGIKIVKIFGKEKEEIERFKQETSQLKNVTIENEINWGTFFPILGFIVGLSELAILYYGSELVLKKRLSVGELVQFTSYTAMIYGPIDYLIRLPRSFAQAMVSARNVFEIIDSEPNTDEENKSLKHKIKGKINFKSATFGYKAYEPIVEDINLEVLAGEMIGIVGHSGAGKSTLINLIMRFYDLDEGQILIDDIDIKDISKNDLYSQVGVVLQETFLFSGTIIENIRYSKVDATIEDIIRVAKIANAHEFIMSLPNRYDTKVGEKGHRLSGGERQRIAIARAILNDPKILILDEATSALDVETEHQIQKAMERLVKGRTTFAIAHRLSTLKNADRLIVLDKGKLVEVGTHDELLQIENGIYKKLVMAQTLMN